MFNFKYFYYFIIIIVAVAAAAAAAHNFNSSGFIFALSSDRRYLSTFASVSRLVPDTARIRLLL